MSTISSLGIGSGLDLSGLLDQLREAERGRLEPINQRKADQEAKLSAYGKVQGALSAFQAAVDKLNGTSLYESVSSSVTGSSVTSAATSEAVPGRYDVSVTALARAQSIATDGFAEGHSFGAGTLSIQAGSGEPVVVAVEEGDTLEDIRDSINASGASITASLINDGDPDKPHRLVLTANETGADAQISSITVTDTDDALAFVMPDADGNYPADYAGMTQTVAAQNAELTVNGIAITSQSNQVEGAIQGVTLELAEEDTATVKVELNNLQLREAVGEFVKTYNALQETTDELTRFDSEAGEDGALIGDSALRMMESRLRTALGGGVSEGAFNALSDVGISIQRDGTLELDEERLDEVIVNDREALTAFFTGDSDQTGFAATVSQTISGMLDDRGLFGTAMSGVETKIASLETQAERMETSVERTIERYRQQFMQLDAMVAEMNQTSTYLTQQFDNLNAMLGRDD
jgi:flagellar hook-associated protein 2